MDIVNMRPVAVVYRKYPAGLPPLILAVNNIYILENYIADILAACFITYLNGVAAFRLLYSRDFRDLART
jgi:hypothetical protein